MEATLIASPAQGVTAGSTLALTLIARNTSPRTLLGVVVAVPVPYGTSYADGSLYHDAVRLRDAAFFGDGCEIAELVPGARTAFMWKLRVEAGDEAIRVVPQIFAGVTPVSGAEPLEVRRASTPRDLASAYGEFERAARAYFAELFGREAPTSLQQALFACALACALDAKSQNHALEVQAHVLHRLARAVRGHYVTGIGSSARIELQALRDAHVAAATIEGLRAFAALDVAARNLAADDRVRDPISFT